MSQIAEQISNISAPQSLVIPRIKWKHLVRSVMRGRNVLMTGPSGCGKTMAAQSIAKAFPDRPYFYFNLGATQDARSSLIGNTHYQPKEGTFVSKAYFVHAIETPNAIILLDELSRGNIDAWNILMTVLDANQRYLRIDEMPDTPTIKVAEGVTFIATANIGIEYSATRTIDRAILDRFSSIVEMQPLSKNEEIALLTSISSSASSKDISTIAEVAAKTRAEVASEDPKISTMLSTRATVEMVSLLEDGFSLEEVAEVSVYPLFPDIGGLESERTYMKQLLQKYLPNSHRDKNLDSTYGV